MIWFFKIFLVIVGAAAFVQAFRMQQQGKRSTLWPSVQGVITTSKKTVSQSKNSISYGAAVSYQFAVGNQTFVGKKITFGDYATQSEARADALLAEYPAGRSVAVFYDPQDPAHCVLEKKMGANWVLFVGGGFAWAMAGYLFVKQ